MFHQLVVCYAASLFEARHSLAYFNIHITITVDDVVEVVVFDDVLWDLGEFYFHIFELGHGSSVVEIFDVEGAPSSVWCADSAVEEDFSGDEASALCGGESVVREFVAADS